MTGIRVLAVALLIGLAGCSWTQTPQASDDFSLTWKVQEPTRTVSKGEIFLTDLGYWAYKPHDRDTIGDDLGVGDVAFLAAESATHYFAIVEITRWGYRLQRLDDQPLNKGLTGDFRRVDNEIIDEQDELCLLRDEAQLSDECGLSYQHRRWHLFALDEPADDIEGSQPLRVDGGFDDFDRREQFPVVQAGLAGGDLLSTWWQHNGDITDDAPLLAIRAEPRVESTLRSTIAYDAICEPELAPSPLVETVAYDFDALGISLPSDPHPITIENTALLLGADAILVCPDEVPSLLVPMLARPMLHDEEEVVFAPPSFGLSARSLEGAASSLTAWTKAGSFIAVGDTTAAAFWIQQAIASGPDEKALDELALANMPVLSAAGRPELAMHTGMRVTSGAWNRENIPDYLDGLIVLLAYFGDHETLQDRIQRRQRLAGQRFNAHRVGWYQWADLRMQLAERTSSYAVGHDELIASLEERGLEGWTLAVWSTLALNDLELPIVDSADDLIPRFSDFGVNDLWRAARGDYHVSECAGDSAAECRLSTYGWSRGSPPGGIDAIERLRTTASNELRGGFTAPDWSDRFPPTNGISQTTALVLALSALVPADELDALTERLITSLAEHVADNPDSLCSELPAWRSRFENAAARTRAPNIDRHRRDWISFVDWWTEYGLIGLCDGAEEFIAAIEDHASSSNPWTRSLLPLVEQQILTQPGAVADSSLFERAAQVARSVGAHDTCTRWSLGVSIGAIRAGHFSAAESHLVTATNCLDSKSPHIEARNLVSSYLDFERGGGRTIVRDGGIERAIASATRRRIDDTDACIGLLPMGFQLESQMPPSVMRIAEHVQLEPAPHDAFGLSTASTLVDEALAAYLTGIRDIHRGQLPTAAKALQLSRTNLRRIGNLPGLARIDFLDHIVFGGNLDRVADDDEFELDAASEAIEKIRAGETYRLIDEASTMAFGELDDEHLSPFVAALLIDGRDAEIADRLDGNFDLFATLCDVTEAPIVQDDEPSEAIIINGATNGDDPDEFHEPDMSSGEYRGADSDGNITLD